MKDTAVILVAGGQGTRFGSTLPKQFVLLGNKPIALYSFERFATLADVSEIMVVCEEPYRALFPPSANYTLSFAQPGARRQDSLFNGLQNLRTAATLICVHDAARPFLTPEMATAALAAGRLHGAAVVGLPCRSTIKEGDLTGFAIRTLEREKLWEVQTPQVIRKTLLEKAFAEVHQHNLTVTDDVSMVELLGHPVKLVPSSPLNLKITLPEDLRLAEAICQL